MKITNAKRRGIALLICLLLLALYFVPAVRQIRVRAMETSSTTQTTDPQYGNERVAANDYKNFPLRESGTPPYVYGSDVVENGDFDSALGVVDAHYTDNLLAGDGTYSYELQENDESGWTTTGTGVISSVDGSYALTVTGQDAVTQKALSEQKAGTYSLALKYKAEEGNTLTVTLGDEQADLLTVPSEADGNYRSAVVILSPAKAFERLVFTSTGTVVLDDVSLRWADIDYGAASSVQEQDVFEGDNLVVDGGTLETYLDDGVTSETAAATVTEAKQGVWSNGVWGDSPATIIRENDNTYAKIGFTEGKGTFAHIIWTFENQGAGRYLVEFDYFHSGRTDNCAVGVNEMLSATNFAGPDTTVLNKGVAIDGKPGWYRFSATFDVTASMRFIRLWYNTAGNANNYLLMDNLSVKIKTGTALRGEGSYIVPTVAPAVPAEIYSFATDAPAVLTKEGGNAIAKMHGAAFSSLFYPFRFEKAGVYAFSFDFRLEGETGNIGLRINPVEDKYTFDIPLLQYEAQWEESELGDDWHRFIYYINIENEVAYKDASMQFWVHSANKATLSVDNLSVKRLVSAQVTGNPVWGKELIGDGGFENMLGSKERYTLPNAQNAAYTAVSSVWSGERNALAKITVKGGVFVAELTGTEGFSSIANRAVLQNEGLYRVRIRYAVSEGYAQKEGAQLTYALGALAAQDILASAVDDGATGFRIYTQYVRLTAEEADAVQAVTVRFACTSGDAAWIDFVSVQKEIGSDIPKEETPGEDITGKVRYDIVKGGDFEGYEEGTSFEESVTDEMFGTTSLDMPAKVVTNDKDALNPSKVLLLQHLAGSQKDFSSAFNLYSSNVELEKGKTYYVSFDYKYNIEEPLDTALVVSDGRRFTMDEGFTFCFVGGTNIGHHEIKLGSVQDGDETTGANNQKCKISKTDLGEGWSRISFSFTANTGINVACNSFRFLLLTNKNAANYAMFDNVAFYTYYDSGEVPPDSPEPPGPDDSEKPDDTTPTPPAKKGCGCGSSIANTLPVALCAGALLIAGAVAITFVRKNKKRVKSDKEEK